MFYLKVKNYVSTIIVFMLVSFNAQSAVIDFEEYILGIGEGMDFAVGTNTQGYTVSPGSWYCNACTYGSFFDELTVLNTDGTGDFPVSTNTAAAYDDIWLTSSGNAFSITQFDFSGAGELWIHGYTDAALSSAGKITAIISQDGSYAFSTHLLDWDNVYGVMFEHINGDIGDASNLLALDNIHVEISAVPLPPALFMFIPGLLSLGFVACRNRSQV